LTVKTVVKSGRTIQEAVQLAIDELNTDLDSVKIDILEEPGRGLLGLIGNKPGKVRVTLKDTAADMAEEFVEKLLKTMGIEGSVTVREKEGNVLYIEIYGQNMGLLIGRRGQTLDAIQYIVSLVVNKKYTRKYYRVIVDTENYRKKREETLAKLAKNLAYKAIRFKKDIVLEPMNPYERRIIHSTLQDEPGITTLSEGQEPYRKVIIKLS